MSQHPTTPARTDVAGRRRDLRRTATALVLGLAVVGCGAGVANALDRVDTPRSQAPAPIVEEGSGADDSTTPVPSPIVEEGSGADDSTTP